MKKEKKNDISKISPEALRKFADVRRIANEAVRKAVEENKKIGVPEGLVIYEKRD